MDIEAEEWQLEWEAPAGGSPAAPRLDAAFVLPRLHINPVSHPGGLPLPPAPPPLPVPLTVGVAAGELRVTLLLDVHPGLASGTNLGPAAGLEAATLRVQDLQARPPGL